ncbi:translocation/assembly module TamB domain-containing protein [Myxosarcina sp. GI1]|uniref:translocation/assembly module TamB domain-containing protein n=1 Tax=Myxosarcina sp. GI1 TaxID=1541065 RepID=UPI00068DA0EE|nr:translocation/assembly module TamB domain-containing protein [Myxosarcina sp. GI1]
MKKKFDRNLEKHHTSGDRQTSPQWRKILITIAILLLGGTVSGLVYGWYLIQNKLIPVIETETSKYLNRPLELGDLQTISPWGARFGNSALPATANNPDAIAVEAVRVKLDPLYFLRRRILQLDIILVRPDIYLEQGEDRIWTPTNFGSESTEDGGIKVDVETIQLQKGKLTLAARQLETGNLNPPVELELDRTIVNLLDDGEQIKFATTGEAAAGGNFTVNGESFSKTKVIDLTLEAERLDATEVSNLLALPIELQQGDISGTIGVTISDLPIPLLEGKATLNDVSLQIPELVKPFSNSNGELVFDGTEIELNNVATNFGEVSGVASGTIDLAEEGDYQVDTKIAPVAVNKVVEALEIEPPAVPIQGKIAGNVRVRGDILTPVVSFDVNTVTPSRIDKIDFKQITANLDLIGTTLFVREFQSLPLSGGQIRGTGTLELDDSQDLAFGIFAQDVAAKKIADSYNNPLPIDIGVVSGQTQLFAQAGNLETLRFDNGSANFALGNGTVRLQNLNSSQGNWQLQVETQDVEFGSLPFGKGSAPTIAKGLVDGVFNVSGKTDGDIDRVRATGKANLDTVGGQIALPQVRIANGTWQADANTDDLQLRRLFPEVPPEFNDDLSGEFYLTGNIPTKPEDTAIINGFGDLDLAKGRVEVRDLNIVDENWKAIATGSNLQLKELSSSTPEQFAGLIDGTVELSGTTDNITPEAITARGNGSLTLPEGVFEAQNLAIANGKFKTTVIPQNVDLSLFADPNSDDIELNGQLGGQLEVTGNVNNLDPTAIAATGNVTFSQGIDLLEQPFSAAVRWNGSRLDVLQAKGEGLAATGYIDLDESFFSDIPDKLAAVNYFEFDVDRADWIDIRKLRVTLPSWATNLDYAGRGDFSGSISGVPAAIDIDGGINLRNFRVEDIAFASLLTGSIQTSVDSGVNLELSQTDAGDPQPDKIELVLDRDFLPVRLAIVRNNIAITGTGEAEILELTTNNVPLEFLKTVAIKSEDIEVPENFAVQPIGGKLSGKFVFNLNTLATSGENVVIDSPSWASIKGERLTGDFQYGDNYFALQNGKFQQRDSVYQLEGSFRQTADDIEVDGRASISQGKIQDILIALQIFELKDLAMLLGDRDYGNAEDLYQKDAAIPPLFSVGFKDAPILEQLQLLAEIQARLDTIEQERQQAFLPKLKFLQGTFNGEIGVSGSAKQGIDSQFDFFGTNWQWGNLDVKQVVASGSYQEGILTLLPISIELQDFTRKPSKQTVSPQLIFTGTFGGETQSGQFRLRQVPVELIEQMFAFSPDIALGGEVNAIASIAGTGDNPQARGEISVDDATINQTSIQSTKGSFNYDNARLDFFASSIIADGAEPLTISGNLPYQLPTATVEPDSDRLELQLNVRDRGLELLDIFSRGELSWIDGQGEIALDVTGKLDPDRSLPSEIVARGTAELSNATIAAKALPDSLLTNVNSKIFFDLNKVRVANFRGDFGGGEIRVAGNLPLTNNLNISEPLTIDLDNIFVNLKEFYEGEVAGELQILGTATEPDLAGDITLYDGTILLADTTATDTENNSIDDLTDSSEGIVALTEYRNLKLKLGENIEISLPPIFTFDASGTLNLNGTFLQPTPEGTINLERGQVNLFTTQLALSRDYNNIARFTDKNGLDPYVDVLMVGSALETNNSRIPIDPLSNEISDVPESSFGTLETVRISAQVKGLASQIANNIELTSSPPRSQTEIFALLGGGLVNTLGRGNSPIGLANLAGSALFGSFNSQFNNAFPIGELRLFPTQIIDEERPDNTINALAGEIAIDLFNNFSFSALKILNVDIPAQFGFRYRLNNNFVLRGSSNFVDETRGLIEYELRF